MVRGLSDRSDFWIETIAQQHFADLVAIDFVRQHGLNRARVAKWRMPQRDPAIPWFMVGERVSTRVHELRVLMMASL